MSQPGTISALSGVTAAKLFAIGTDTIIATASTVTAGTNDPTHYTITFSGVTVGDYRLVLFSSTTVVAVQTVVTVTDNGWSIPVETGTGARTVTITVEIAAVAVEGAVVRVTKGSETFVGVTDNAGQIVFSLDDGNWTVAITSPGALFTSTTLTVNENETVTYTMTLAGSISPSAPGMRSGYLVCYDEDGVVEVGVSVTLECYYAPDTGLALDSKPRVEVSDVNGVVTFTNLIIGAKYSYMRNRGKYKITVPAGSGSFAMDSIVGEE